MTIFQIIGIIIGIIILYLLIVTFSPGFSVPEQRLEKTKQLTKKVHAKPSQSRKDVSFKVKGTSISAWLYVPVDLSTPVPCIIMGHGFGGTKDMIMESYALRYQGAGFAVLAFDYRHFGESEGEPRQLVLISYQLEDYTAAIAYARGLDEIDSARIALWGTSASGGYGIVIAAKDKNIACVVAQCPGLDHRASEQMFRKKLGIGHILRLFVHGQRDMGRSRLVLSPHKIPIVGKPGTMAFFPISDAYEGYRKLASKHFINEVCARVILRSHGYRPDKHIRNVRCPVLIQICDHDSLAPISAETEKELSKYAEIKHYPIGHFDIYTGENFERSVSDQIEFFKKHL
ncbi:alpha/beta fold hydrolase [candidate division WOR-3 bacterium]|nr:alpha/beta fold hydrolase [candidate division WOR-3 bacterium]